MDLEPIYLTFMDACTNNDMNTMKSLLDDNRFDPNINDGVLFVYAATTDNFKAAELLYNDHRTTFSAEEIRAFTSDAMQYM